MREISRCSGGADRQSGRRVGESLLKPILPSHTARMSRPATIEGRVFPSLPMTVNWKPQNEWPQVICPVRVAPNAHGVGLCRVTAKLPSLASFSTAGAFPLEGGGDVRQAEFSWVLSRSKRKATPRAMIFWPKGGAGAR